MRRKPVPQPLTLADAASSKTRLNKVNASSHDVDATTRMTTPGGTGATSPGNSIMSAATAETPRSQHSSSRSMSASRPPQPSPPSQPSQPSQSSPPPPLALLTSRFNATGRRPQTAQAGRGVQHQQNQQQHQQQHQHLPQSRDDTATPKSPSPVPSPDHGQSPAFASPPSRHAATEAGRQPGPKSGFFHFNKSSPKTSGQLRTLTSPYFESRKVALAGDPDGSRPPKSEDPSYEQNSLPKSKIPVPSRSELSLSSAGDYDPASVPPPLPANSKRSKSKTFALLNRSKSNRDKDYGHIPATSPPPPPTHIRNHTHDTPSPLRTAPIAQDWGLKDTMNSTARNRSEDRAVGRDASRDKERGALPTSSKDNGSNFLSGLRNSSNKAADIISKGLFGKSSKSGITVEREPIIDDEHYVLKVINLPLVEQTRRTRISKRLESSRDKTEFWMPAFPWRAIDYLNYKGCDIEGLYRVPGSGPQIKKWQRKFDEEYDVNLFEEDSLYDINIIGSMLKAWLRELPDELFPKEAQDRIARECSGATEVPQMLIEELSKLSPFNYYLLFAITCHLSLLLAHSDKNKMDFRNLCICFQPCMKIDAFCFKFLVCNWRNCWKGCRNEAKYIEEEYRLFDQPPPRGIAEPNCPTHHEDTNGHHQSPPLDSPKPSSFSPPGVRLKYRKLSGSNASIGSKVSSTSTNVTRNSERELPEGARDMRPLSPIQPLSPIGF